VSAQAPDSPEALRARALRLLARREHTRAELARRLSAHAESVQALESLLDALQARKHLSDERYAEARAHRLARKYGAARIRHELRARGVAEEVLQRVTPQDELERARAILARRYRDAATGHEERARRARFLLARGFSHEIIRRALALSSQEAC
jgi:regulatory protein